MADGIVLKRCITCGENKPTTDYHARKGSADGLRGSCKPCRVKNATEWIHNNRERYNARIRADRAKNPAKYAGWAAAYQDADRERYLSIKKAWVEKNKEKRAATLRRYLESHRAEETARVRLRQATQAMATPAWADIDLIKDLYRLARLWSDATGVAHHVDHIVPIRSKAVCGLHCEANLTVIEGTSNRSKGNRWWPDMP